MPTEPSTRRLLDRVGTLRTGLPVVDLLDASRSGGSGSARTAGPVGKLRRPCSPEGIADEVVSDRLPDARRSCPTTRIGCKRILISNDWYPTLLRPDVEVVDSPSARIEPDAVVTADGVRHPADVLIFGTGFATTDFLSHIPVTGVGGRRLAEAWSAGAHAYLGSAVPGFPNCYLLYGPNTNLGHNSILFMVERQLNLVLQALATQTRSLTGTAAPTVSVREPPTSATTEHDPVADGPDGLGWPLHAAGTRTPIGPGHQQLADLDGPLLVGHPPDPAGRLRGVHDEHPASRTLTWDDGPITRACHQSGSAPR